MSAANLTVPEKKALRSTVAAFAVLGAVGLFLGYPNPVYQLPGLVLLFPACLVTLARIAPTRKSAFYAGWLCATLGMSACLYWVAVPMHDFGQVPWLLTAPAVLSLGGYLGLYGGAFTLIYRIFRERLPLMVAVALVLPLWTALDLARGWLFTGFPWISLATAFIAWPEWAQSASILGADALSGVYALAAAAVAEARPVRVPFGGSGIRLRTVKQQWFCYALALVCIGIPYAHGMFTLRNATPQGEEVSIALVQGNVDQSQKWAPAYQSGTVARYISLSQWAVDPALGKVAKPVDLIIWPETSMPFYLETNRMLARRITAFAERNNVALAFGAPGKAWDTTGEKQERYRNRLWLYTPLTPEQRLAGTETSPQAPGSPGGPFQFYDKVHLVPFGEYAPLSIPLPFIERLLQDLNFTPGEGGGPLLSGRIALGPLICYEAIFPALARERVAAGANLLVTISNDAWFGRTPAPVQHLHLTAMRAIETGRYIVRATNTGVSAVIDAHGRIRVHGNLFRPETILGNARLLDGTTPYTRTAPYGAWVAILTALGALAFSLSRQRRGIS